jgi:AcrR family transcriptional regulator
MDEKRASPRTTYDRRLDADGRYKEQRERILLAAMALYGERGYSGTRMRDVAERAEVSRQTIYFHFRDIGELRFALFERALGTTLVAIARTALDTSLYDPLGEALSMAFRTVATHRNLARVVLMEARMPDAKNIELRAGAVSFFVSALMDAIQTHYREGSAQRLPDELTVVGLVGAVEGLFVHTILNEDVDPLDAVPAARRIIGRVYPSTIHPSDLEKL